jgi:hypothetical protein
MYNGDPASGRVFRESHVGAAAGNTLVVGGLLWLFCKISLSTVMMLPLLVVLTWCGARLFIKRSEQMSSWDEVDISRLALCLLASVLVTYAMGLLLGMTLGMGPLYMSLIYVACWALLFPSRSKRPIKS